MRYALFFQTEIFATLGALPDAAGLFVFGAVLIAFAASLRRFFDRQKETNESDEKFAAAEVRRRVG